MDNRHLLFLAKVAVIIAIPPMILIFVYLTFDPFKILRPYDNYFANGLSVNKGMVTVTTFEAENDNYHYNSFILGSSIACYYNADTWKNFLTSDARPYHFDTSNQPIKTLRRTVEYLEKNADSIKNVLIVLDPFIFRITADKTDMVLIDPYQIRDEWWYKTFFHYKMICHFFNIKYLVSYLPWLWSGEEKCYSDINIFEPQPIEWRRDINEESIPLWDDSISLHPKAFYSTHRIYCTLQPYYSSNTNLIDNDKEKDIQTIADILERNGTSYKVVVGPNLRHEVLNDCDDMLLSSIFGEHYYNLGKEFAKEMSDSTNFYDNTHYRPSFASKIMHRIYSKYSDTNKKNQLIHKKQQVNACSDATHRRSLGMQKP